MIRPAYSWPMDSLQATFYQFGIAAACATIIASLVATFVQISKLPRGWYVTPLAVAIVLAPPVLIVLGLIALYLAGALPASALWLAALVMHAIGFARLPEPSSRGSIAWFVVISAVIGASIPTVVIADLVDRVVEVQSLAAEAQNSIIDTQSKTIDVIRRLVGAPEPN
jgi:hypothetical protein